MIEEKSVRTKYSEGIERIYTYQITKQYEENIIEYGIEAKREDKSQGSIIKIVKSQIKNISSDQDRMDEIINLLWRNEVSPIHLQDILSDYIDKYVS
ncbi:hypothetical protein SAMN04487886_100342 [Clostridium sp. DSM 8431]|uniref:DUF6514 family protein n=1 Tax=Clostridium sp. DSM 8431 TaxID=1761781 RepID=UPI0008F2351A|nr:DUF6514 family protein [Clostridium sp. DSM 8431]SFU29496.1 hypothetical protein SAMN04487886_100342 [Clostridium sp. DSM 8431]